MLSSRLFVSLLLCHYNQEEYFPGTNPPLPALQSTGFMRNKNTLYATSTVTLFSNKSTHIKFIFVEMNKGLFYEYDMFRTG